MTFLDSSSRSFKKTLDWWLIGSYLLLAVFSVANIFASIQGDNPDTWFNPAFRSGRQCLWILTSLGLGMLIVFVIPPKAYNLAAPFLYMVVLVLLVLVIFVGGTNKGSNSWFNLGPVSFQPAELSKITVSLMLSYVMSRPSFRMNSRNLLAVLGVILLPMLIIVLEKETGSALVYIGFVFMLYREGFFSGWFLAAVALLILSFIFTITVSSTAGILIVTAAVSLFDSVNSGHLKWWMAIAVPLIAGDFFLPETLVLPVVVAELSCYVLWSLWRAFRGRGQSFRIVTLAILVGGAILVFSSEFIFNNVLKGYQRDRIEVLLGMKDDPSGAGYNVKESMIAIGSGGWTGKGFCSGTQTAYGFVPEQSTDFIFCTVGEEWGFWGGLFMLALYCIMICRIIIDSEHSRESFARIYGYCFASCLFMHLLINVGMTLGMMPIIGIPLPFMSYGGSSMWAFSIMLFIFVALDRNERKYF